MLKRKINIYILYIETLVADRQASKTKRRRSSLSGNPSLIYYIGMYDNLIPTVIGAELAVSVVRPIMYSRLLVLESVA